MICSIKRGFFPFSDFVFDLNVKNDFDVCAWMRNRRGNNKKAAEQTEEGRKKTIGNRMCYSWRQVVINYFFFGLAFDNSNREKYTECQQKINAIDICRRWHRRQTFIRKKMNCMPVAYRLIFKLLLDTLQFLQTIFIFFRFFSFYDIFEEIVCPSGLKNKPYNCRITEVKYIQSNQ